MSDKPQPRNDALEALDFIVNVLKEHEKDLDKLISELGTITEQISNTGELSEKIENITKKIDLLQKEVTAINQTPTTTKPAPTVEQKQPSPATSPIVQAQVPLGPQLNIKCKNWDDFQNLAINPQMLSFNFKESERVLEVHAVKGNQLISFSGELPRLSVLLKTWLSVQFAVPETAILNGVLSLGQ
jgi:prefoldin subunit 5